jgi:hypothetical protein
MHVYRHAEQLESSEVPLEIAANHMVVSILGLVEWWLVNNLRYPVEQMGSIYRRLVIEATWHAILPENRMILPWGEPASKEGTIV